MGYCISVKKSEFKIKAENKVNACKVVRALHGRETCGDHFSWVNENFHQLPTLEDMLKAWRWRPKLNENYDIVGLEFSGEKMGDDKLFFTTIAPYVEAGSYIHFVGECGAQWRYEFDGNVMVDRQGKVTFE